MSYEYNEYENNYPSYGGPHRSMQQEFGEHEFEFEPSHELEGQGQYGYEYEGGGGAVALDIPAAIAANRTLARRVGFGCVVGGTLQNVIMNLGLPRSPSETQIVRAIAAWQSRNGLRADGQVGPTTWARMRADAALGIPRTSYQPFSMTVQHAGRTLGVIEKAAPYRDCYSDAPTLAVRHPPCRRTRNNSPGERGGSEIQLGFRVTDMAAVTAAGFVDGAGAPQFRWVQVVQFRAPLSTDGVLRRFNQVIDPTILVGMPNDNHPYYWYENIPVGSGLSRGFLNTFYTNRPTIDPSGNGLCYDLLFYDKPAFSLAVASPTRRALFNFETALIGVRGTIGGGGTVRNVVLNTFTWGQDLVRDSAGRVEVRMNALGAGAVGGSATFRNVVSREIGRYPGHCFVGAYPTGTRCP